MVVKKYKHIYFDLDRTLWDFESNSMEALLDIYHKYDLGRYFNDGEDFVRTYHLHNERLWAQYRDGNLTKEILRSKRFRLCLEERKVKNNDLAHAIGEEYLILSTLKNKLFPNVHEILTWLKEHYHLYILTNGFRETQLGKLKNCNLEGYFEKVFTSETIGYNKPNQKIFHWAVSSINADKDQCLMIGDDEMVDIAGAKKFGMDSIFFNPQGIEYTIIPTHEIRDLIELKNIL